MGLREELFFSFSIGFMYHVWSIVWEATRPNVVNGNLVTMIIINMNFMQTFERKSFIVLHQDKLISVQLTLLLYLRREGLYFIPIGKLHYYLNFISLISIKSNIFQVVIIIDGKCNEPSAEDDKRGGGNHYFVQLLSIAYSLHHQTTIDIYCRT